MNRKAMQQHGMALSLVSLELGALLFLYSRVLNLRPSKPLSFFVSVIE